MKTSTTAERLQQIMDERNLKQVDVLALAQPYCKKYGVSLGKTALSPVSYTHLTLPTT